MEREKAGKGQELHNTENEGIGTSLVGNYSKKDLILYEGQIDLNDYVSKNILSVAYGR